MKHTRMKEYHRNTEKTKQKQNIHVTDVAKAMVIIHLLVF